jgi:hypothetical protein
MFEEERPVHLVVSCDPILDEEARVQTIPVTDSEWAEMKAAAVLRDEDRAKEAAEEEVLRLAVQNHPDPVVQALGKKLGIV